MNQSTQSPEIVPLESVPKRATAILFEGKIHHKDQEKYAGEDKVYVITSIDGEKISIEDDDETMLVLDRDQLIRDFKFENPDVEGVRIDEAQKGIHQKLMDCEGGERSELLWDLRRVRSDETELLKSEKGVANIQLGNSGTIVHDGHRYSHTEFVKRALKSPNKESLLEIAEQIIGSRLEQKEHSRSGLGEDEKEDLELALSRITAIQSGLHEEYDIFSEPEVTSVDKIVRKIKKHQGILTVASLLSIPAAIIVASYLNFCSMPKDDPTNAQEYSQETAIQHKQSVEERQKEFNDVMKKYFDDPPQDPKKVYDQYKEHLKKVIATKEPRKKVERKTLDKIEKINGSGKLSKLSKEGLTPGVSPSEYIDPEAIITYQSLESDRIFWKLKDFNDFHENKWKDSTVRVKEDKKMGNKDLENLIFDFESNTYSKEEFEAIVSERTEPFIKNVHTSNEYLQQYLQPIDIEVPDQLKELILKHYNSSYSQSSTKQLTSFEEFENNFDDLYKGYVVKAMSLAVSEYFSYISGDKNVSEAYTNSEDILKTLIDLKKGDCDIVNTYHVALLRKFGIPARLSIGYASTNGQVLRTDAHGWAEALLEDGWEISDATPADPQALRNNSGNIAELEGMSWEEYRNNRQNKIMNLLIRSIKENQGSSARAIAIQCESSYSIRTQDLEKIIEEFKSEKDPETKEARGIAYILMACRELLEQSPSNTMKVERPKIRQDALDVYNSIMQESKNKSKIINILSPTSDEGYIGKLDDLFKYFNSTIIIDAANQDLDKETIFRLMDGFTTWSNENSHKKEVLTAAKKVFNKLSREHKELYLMESLERHNHNLPALLDELDTNTLNNIIVPKLLQDYETSYNFFDTLYDKVISGEITVKEYEKETYDKSHEYAWIHRALMESSNTREMYNSQLVEMNHRNEALHKKYMDHDHIFQTNWADPHEHYFFDQDEEIINYVKGNDKSVRTIANKIREFYSFEAEKKFVESISETILDEAVEKIEVTLDVMERLKSQGETIDEEELSELHYARDEINKLYDLTPKKDW